MITYCKAPDFFNYCLKYPGTHINAHDKSNVYIREKKRIVEIGSHFYNAADQISILDLLHVVPL